MADEQNHELQGETALVSLVSKAELDQSIATAHQWPRSITKFRREALEMATMDEQTAQECIYALPRREDGQVKMITGPSARLAEIIISAWGNVRAGARVIDEGREFVTAQGVFHDLEKNVGITYEVKRRITNREGRRFTADMIAVTSNAACSIALRNAVFKGVPKALWAGVEAEVRRVIAGDAKTLGARREKVISALNKMGVPNEKIFAVLGVPGLPDIGLDEIVILQGLGNSIKEGEMTIEEAFMPKDGPAPANRSEAAKDALRSATANKQAQAVTASTDPTQPAATQATAAVPASKQPEPAQQKAEHAVTAKENPWDDPAPSGKAEPTDETWIAEFKACKSFADLKTSWGHCVSFYDEKNAEVPIDVEATMHMMKEQLEGK